MIISIIAALAHHQVIGNNHGLPWHLPADTAYFKSKIEGYSIIMGRKSHEADDVAYSDRYNIIMTNQTDLTMPEGFVSANSFEEAIRFLEEKNEKEAFVLGGSQIYEIALPFADWLYLTRIDAHFEGDTFFPDIEWENWLLESSEKHSSDAENQYPYTFEVYRRK
jgi:dihydrofolate reductase